MGPESFYFDDLPGDADTTGQGSTLWEPLP